MQCPLAKFSCCFMSPQMIFMAIAVVGFGLGFLSAFWPGRSIGLYQGIMARINWKVTPIDEAKEIRNTRRLGVWLILLDILLVVAIFVK